MWPRKSHTLAPLTRLTSIKRKFKWRYVKKYAFEEIKRILARDTLLNYPDFNETFKIHTDNSALQLGSVIIQKDKPIVFYSKKLTDTQQRYTVTKRELLSIVETLKEFRTILLGQKLRIYTENRNITYRIFNTNRVLIWILILEEYGPDIKYIKSEKNIVAEALSRSPINGNQEVTQNSTYQK